MNHHHHPHAEPAQKQQIEQWHELSQTSRRNFLQVMGASLALASGGCLPQPKEKIVPYVRAPEYSVPGRPQFFATALTLGGYATGILVENHLGRPTKIEGNPDHPASRGATDAITQAAILDLYDPDRSQAITHGGEVQTWQSLADVLRTALAQQQTNGGQGVRILSESSSSPTLLAQINELLVQYPQARWYQFEPVNRDNFYEGSVLAFGKALDVNYAFDGVDVAFAIDADFLASGPGNLIYAREFMANRDPLQWDPVSESSAATNRRSQPNRLFALESMPSCTGTIADSRLSLSPHQIELAVQYLAMQIITSQEGAELPALKPEHRGWLEAVSKELLAAGARGVVVAGPSLTARSQALVHGMNQALGNFGSVVRFIEPVLSPAPHGQALAQLTREMQDGDVQVLIILEGNPAFTAPIDIPFAKSLKKVPLSVHLSLYEDETSALCTWHVPAAHSLESWSDARAFDGSACIIQPLIAPLYEGKATHELTALLAGNAEATGYELVRNYWRSQWLGDEFETSWYQALHEGVIRGSQSAPASPSPALVDGFAELIRAEAERSDASQSGGTYEICLRPDPAIYDGRFANNGWLQELPKPVTKLTWDNAALISPETARQFNVQNEDVLRIVTSDGQLELPAWIVPGHANECVTIYLGYGRRRAGNVAKGAGANAFLLRSSQNMWSAPGAKLTKTGSQKALACTQLHHQMQHSHPAKSFTLEKYHAFAKQPHEHHEHPSLYDPADRPTDDLDYAWGMSINLNTCIGCGACVVACQAENNIPVVGKEMVIRGREMHWLRIDTYFAEQGVSEAVIHQPLACVHCETAPCELVCPVGATVHSAEGLNEMVYNRCVGTRYCSHNCPYKVRRFNFFDYTHDYSNTLQMMQNPDVTVRMRGVMEKCTYCVQRINAGRIEAKKEERRIADGEVVTACQAACPTRAIQFGDIADKSSAVSVQKKHPLTYALLGELNTKPRSTYVSKVIGQPLTVSEG